MWNYPIHYDVIVIGAGHAGCEAAYASSTMGGRTLLLTMNIDTIGKMSCNPSIGGTAKGHIVREIDALGGIMGKVADRSAIQYRLLNRSRGVAVRSPRCQSDKIIYQSEMKHLLEKTPNLDIRQNAVEEIVEENGIVIGVKTKEGIFYSASNVILSSGTFMRGLMHIGQTNMEGGRGGESSAKGISANLQKLGFTLGRLKTGTPPRILKKSVDFSKLEEQFGDEDVCFSFDEKEKRLPQITCHIGYTNPKTHAIIEKNLAKSPVYSGALEGVGPRYCPSIEDKVVRFNDKNRHQIFLEPEGLHTEEMYVNGVSTGLPSDVQYAMLRTIEGLESVSIMRDAYAIEYDFVISGQIFPTMETKNINGLFFAGQINGTTGYEEAAAQGLIAGINAMQKVFQKKSFIPSRLESYIGVMLDDITTMEITEPYRMFTSRAEQRLLLHQDNADLRLRHYGYELGLINQAQYEKVVFQKKVIEEEKKRLANTKIHYEGKKVAIAQLLCRPEITYSSLLASTTELKDHGSKVNGHIENDLKYAGYIERQKKEIAKLKELENIKIPVDFSYEKIKSLKKEAFEKLQYYRPTTLASASRIFGVTNADISVLLIALTKK